jgi:repressor LexA
MNVSITDKQDKVLTFIRDYYLEKGLAPSLSELQEYLHIKTKRGVVGHLEALERKGFIIRTGGPRGIQLQDEENYEYLIGIPVLGYANAGIPLATAVEDYIGTLKVDKKLLKNKSNLFSVILKGDSMNKHLIGKTNLSDGNYIIVDKEADINNGDTVLAIIDNSATVKIFHKQDNVIILYPRSYNDSYQPIYLDKGRENIINGKVIMALDTPKQR